MFAKPWVWLALLFVASGVLFGIVSRVAAENVTVTIGVGDTVLVVTGTTSPQAFVTIKNDDNVIGTTTALADGSYSKTFSAQAPGLHKVSVSAHTPSGLTTDAVTLHLGLIEHATTTVELFLPPTVAIDDAGLDKNQPLILSGETAPLMTVKLFLDDAEYTTAVSDGDGKWKLSIDSDSFANGQHLFFLRAFDSGGAQSYPTVSRSFTYSREEVLEVPVNAQPDVTLPGESLNSPVITFPVSGTSWDRPELIIRGTAPRGVQVEVWDGTRLLGSAWADSEGDWSLKLLLESHEYSLRARSCMNGICSEFSPMTLFTYNSIHEALYLRVPQTIFNVTRGDRVTLKAEAVHGRSPYEAKLYWGDKTTDSLAIKHDEMSFSHTYAASGKYTATLEVRDARGQLGGVQFAIHVQDRQSQGVPLYVVAPIILATILALVGIKRLWRWYKIRHKTP